MNPALSVLFFTTLSGAGYGLLLWLGLSILLLHGGEAMPALRLLHLWQLGLGVALSSIGLLCSLGHLGKPLRAWRALSQWRTSWLSREGVLALATLVPAAAVGVLLLVPAYAAAHPWLLPASGLLLALLALATVSCTAMIYASLRPIPAWRHPLVLPVYLLFAALTGLALAFLLMTIHLPAGREAREMLAMVAGLGTLTILAKVLYWGEIDRAPAPATRGAAVGLPQRDVSVFERPHTEQNYITREMAFVVARERARALRLLAVALVAGGPLLALAATWLWGGSATVWLGVCAGATLAGSFVERWLFFAQARHVVATYY